MLSESMVQRLKWISIAVAMTLMLMVSTGLSDGRDDFTGTDAATDNNETQEAVFVADQLVVKFTSDTLAWGYVGDTYGFTLVAPMTRSGAFLVATSGGEDPLAAAVEIGDDPNVEYAHPNYLVSRLHPVQGSYPFSDVAGTGSYSDQPSAQTLDLDASHLVSTGTGVVVAVIDGGVDFDHITVAGKAVSGYDFVDDDDLAFDEPGGINSGHGTFVAGIVLLGAPDAQVTAYRVTSPAGRGDGFTLARAIEQAVSDGCDIINLSLVLTGEHLAVRDAISYAESQGVVVVGAAGNSGDDIPFYPALDERTLAVAAIDSLNVLADFSSYGSHIDVCAPGTRVYSAYTDDGFAWWSGTSFATPFVSAQAALLRELKPLATAASIRAAVIATADNLDDLNPEITGLIGSGLVRPGLSQTWITTSASASVTPDTMRFVHEFGAVYFRELSHVALLTSTNQPVPYWIEVPDNDRFISVGDSTGFTPDSVTVVIWSLNQPPGVYYDTVLFHVAGVDDPVEMIVELTVTSSSLDMAYINPSYLKFTAPFPVIDTVLSGMAYLTSSNAPAPYFAEILPGGGGFTYLLDSIGTTPDWVTVSVSPSNPLSAGTYYDTVAYYVEGVSDPAYLTLELELVDDSIMIPDNAWLNQDSARYFAMIENTYTVLTGCIDVMSTNAPAPYWVSHVDPPQFLQLADSVGTTNGTTCFYIPNPGLPVGTYVDTLAFWVGGVNNNPLLAPVVLSITSDSSGVPMERVRIVVENETGPGGLGVTGGNLVDVSISCPDSGYAVYPMGGYDFLMAFDSEALFFIQASPGAFMQDCEWEYFNYRVDSGLTAPTPSGLIRVVALADINNGSTVKPSCYMTAGVSTELAVMQFVVKYDILEDSLFTPIRFYWRDCGDNVVSSIMGDTLLISRQIYDYDGSRLDNPGFGMPGLHGADYTCEANINIRGVDFFNGGVKLYPSDDPPITDDSLWVEPRAVYMSAPHGETMAQWGAVAVRSNGQPISYFAYQLGQADFITYIDSVGMANDSLSFLATTTVGMAPGTYEDTIIIEPFNSDAASTYAVVYMTIDSGSVIPTEGVHIVIETETGSDGMGVFAGDTADVSISYPVGGWSGYPMGGYDFLMAYDLEMITLLDAQPGAFMQECGWEYFTTADVPYLNMGLVRIIAVADLNNGETVHPSCLSTTSGSEELAVLKYVVTESVLDDCLFSPIRFYWMECGDNVLSSTMGDTLAISRYIYDYNGSRLDDTAFGMPGYNGAPYSCDAPNNIRTVDFYNGGVKLFCPDDTLGNDSLFVVPRYAYLTAPQGQQTVQWTSFQILSTGSPIPYVAWQSDNPDFILVFDSTGMTGDSLLVSVTTPAELPAGVWEDTLMVAVPGAFNSPEFVVIRVTVQEGGSPCDRIALAIEMFFTLAWNEQQKSQTFDLGYCIDSVPWVGYVAGGAGSFVTLPDTSGMTGTTAQSIEVVVNRPDEFAGAYSDTVVFMVDGFDRYILLPVNLVTMDTVSSILVSAAPNPFNPTLRISFALPDAADVRLDIYNVLGRKVATLVDSHYGPGSYDVMWNGSDQASGVYFYRLQAGDVVVTRKAVLLK